jgi:hypothetical protein
MIKSDPRPWSDYFQAGKEPDGIKDKEALATIRTNAQFLMQRVVGAKATDKVTKEEVAANVEARRVKINQLANAVAKAGLTKTGTAAEKPISKINYGGTTDEGGAKSATAAILSEKHPDGTTVRDFPSIWTDIVPDRRKLYVQGHLLNRLLGGEGRRFNLTPITISANSLHEKRFESHVKRWVDTEGQVVSYSVKADYSGSHAEPAGYTKLKSRPNPDKALLKSYQTEMALARRFKIKAEVLKWNKDKTWKTDPKPDKGHQPLDDNLDTPIAP